MFCFAIQKNISLFLFSTVLALPVLAHNVEISGNVAATFHIEPNHNPRVGTTSQAWFALTRRGGQTIPLSQCSCKLSVYTLPRTANSQPILNPNLEAINVEKYQEVPGANIIFSQAGAYELEILGTAKDGISFKPFKFSYTVNVRP